MAAKSNSTRLRFWQPEHEGAYYAFVFYLMYFILNVNYGTVENFFAHRYGCCFRQCNASYSKCVST